MISLKSIKSMFLVTVALGAGFVLSTKTATIHADTTTNSTSSSTTATFNAFAGAGTNDTTNTTSNEVGTSGLYLTSVPSTIKISAASVASIISGSKIDGTSNGNITVSDYSGNSSSSWTLAATVTKFKNSSDSSATLDGTLSFGLTDTEISLAGYTKGTGLSDVTLTTTSTPVLTDASTGTGANYNTAGSGVANVSLSDVYAKFPTDSKPSTTGNYNATVNWTLSNTASSH